MIITRIKNRVSRKIKKISLFLKAPRLRREIASFSIKEEGGLNKDTTRAPELIVSLTTYSARIGHINSVLYSLLNQTLRPDKIILSLASEEFTPPGAKAPVLPPSLLQSQNSGITVEWYHNIRSYKKLIPALKAHPQAVIVTADDDVFYPPDWLAKLYNAYQRAPQNIYCHRAHKIRTSGEDLLPYTQWLGEAEGDYPSFRNFFTGVGGVLYPPGALHKDILNEDLFMSLAPRGDDIWFWAMAVLNGAKIAVVKDNMDIRYPDYLYRRINRVKSSAGLMDSNVAGGGNDAQLKVVFAHYPDLKKIINSRQ